MKIILNVVLILMALILSVTPLFKLNKKQKLLLSKGMRMMSKPRHVHMIAVAMGILIFVFTAFFMILAFADGAWEEAKSMMILCMVLGTLTPLLFFMLSYIQYANHILYNDEKILIGRAFRDYEQVYWRELTRMKVVNQDFFYLYDIEDRRRVSADAGYVNYEDFLRTARKHCNPERELYSGDETAYQEKYSVRSGHGIMRCRTEEYYAFFVISLLLLLMAFLSAHRGGKSVSEFINEWRFMEVNIFVKLAPFLFPLISGLLLVFVQFRQIDYDMWGIEVKEPPKKTLKMKWSEIDRIEVYSYYQGTSVNWGLALYKGKRCFVIKQHKYRKGFPEFEEFIKKMIEKYGIQIDGKQEHFIGFLS